MLIGCDVKKNVSYFVLNILACIQHDFSVFGVE